MVFLKSYEGLGGHEKALAHMALTSSVVIFLTLLVLVSMTAILISSGFVAKEYFDGEGKGSVEGFIRCVSVF